MTSSADASVTDEDPWAVGKGVVSIPLSSSLTHVTDDDKGIGTFIFCCCCIVLCKSKSRGWHYSGGLCIGHSAVALGGGGGSYTYRRWFTYFGRAGADPIAAAVCCWLRALLLAFDGAIVCYEKRNEMRLQSMFELAMVEILTKVSFNIIKSYFKKYLLIIIKSYFKKTLLIIIKRHF